MSALTGGDQRLKPINYRFTHACRNCDNENASETMIDWGDSIPVACGECGERDWQLVDKEALR